jgi:hypothetical protein
MMRIMAANIDERVVELWDEVIPKLIAYIEANRTDWKQTNWEVGDVVMFCRCCNLPTYRLGPYCAHPAFLSFHSTGDFLFASVGFGAEVSFQDP